jgi:hypothetical protein
MDYFSKYPIERCSVPLNEKCQNKAHGIITFRHKDSVDAVMSQRFHQIDGKDVLIHRSIPTERSLNDNCRVRQLIVSGLENQSEIIKYFSSYGDICNISNMNNDDNVWVIDFD